MTSEDTDIDDSRRDFVKMGALASGAAALGLSGASLASEGSESAQQQRTLVFAYEYYPGNTFVIEASLQTSTVVEILNGPDDQGVDEISQPDEYNGYIIRYQLGGDGQQSGIYGMMFTQQSLDTDTEMTFSGDAQVFSTTLNLLDAQTDGGDGGGTPTPTPGDGGGGGDGGGNQSG